ncbi:MAG: MBL fold metallo-hydrolase [Verrucomicrobia bacterium]|nr:MBL fold metallo-hydrolase [Verrucomicrobiota bacterium]
MDRILVRRLHCRKLFLRVHRKAESDSAARDHRPSEDFLVTQVIVLGSGTSQGVPVIGCRCPVCTSTDARNQRSRASASVRFNDRRIVIDTAPEFRLQCVRHGIDRLDAVLFTHAHADHVHGLDDVRQFNQIQGTRIPCYGNPETMADLARKFDYFFIETQAGGGKPNVEFIAVEGPFELFGREIVPLPVLHGRLPVYGYRIGPFAYITDASEIPPETMAKLGGLDTLVLNALRLEPHPTHLSIGQAAGIIRQLEPRHAFLTHLTHRLDHADTEARLPPPIRLAYDGLTLDIPD